MNNYFALIFLVLLSSCANSNEKATTSNKAENSQKKYRNYEFDVTINVVHSGNDFKYLINVSNEFDDNHNIIDYEDNLLQYTTYKYQKSEKFGDRYYDRVPIKTIQYSLNRAQLDTIYLLTAKLFQPDTLNLTNDTNRSSRIYDGYGAEIVLTDRYDAIYDIKLGGYSNKTLLKNYRNLLFYIEKSKKKVVHKPGKMMIEPK
jgi:hypothetical protein